MAAFDLLIHGGTVFDPEQCSFHQEDIAVRDGAIVRCDAGFSGEEAENILDASGCIVSPGLIDMHCHIYPVFPYVRRDSLRTTNAEEHMVRCGVTTAVDAGTCGWRNFGDFKENVIDATKLRVLAFLDIAAKGMAYPDSEQAVADINPKIAAAVAREWSDCIVGIKSAHYWPRHENREHPAFASIDGAREAAALCGKPVMVDSIPVVPERSYPAILSRLEPGDIHTHVFAQQFPLLNAQGKVEGYLRKERERGVRFDVGHGSGSFWFRQAVPCFEQDFWPDKQFWSSLGVTLMRVVIGVPINIFLCVMTAYPLSKSNNKFHARTVFSWFFVFTMLFSGGQIPLYMVVSKLGMINTIWALTLPGALNVSYVILMLNFFRGIPTEVEDAAVIDGASQMKVLFLVYLPMSLPSLATIILFATVANWNVWMDGYIYMNTPDKYPLQTYLATLLMESKNNVETLMTPEQLARMEQISEKTIEAAQIFLAALPIMCVYPFLQKYYIKGIVVGSVKG